MCGHNAVAASDAREIGRASEHADARFVQHTGCFHGDWKFRDGRAIVNGLPYKIKRRIVACSIDRREAARACQGTRISGSPMRILEPSRIVSQRSKPSGASTTMVEPCSNQPISSPRR